MKQTWNVEGAAYRIPRDHKPIALVYDPTPGGRENEDGTTTHSLRFPALILTDIVSDGEKVAQQLADELNRFPKLVEALKEAERFMAYFAGETDGHFVGPGTPQSCLEQIRAAITSPSRQGGEHG